MRVKMNNWKQMFTSKILDRGYAYYTDGWGRIYSVMGIRLPPS